MRACVTLQHRTGSLVGVLRRAQGWCHSAICEEYRRFSHPKERMLDQQFIELFDLSAFVIDLVYAPAWLPHVVRYGLEPDPYKRGVIPEPATRCVSRPRRFPSEESSAQAEDAGESVLRKSSTPAAM
jgi:hypothetical protein